MNLYEVLYNGSDGIARERFKADYARIDEAGNLKFYRSSERESVVCFDDMNWIGWKLLKREVKDADRPQEKRDRAPKLRPFVVTVLQKNVEIAHTGYYVATEVRVDEYGYLSLLVDKDVNILIPPDQWIWAQESLHGNIISSPFIKGDKE